MKQLELKIPPVIVVFLVAVAMWLMAKVMPRIVLSFEARYLILLAFNLVGFLIALSGVRAFRKAQTTVNPVKPDTASSLVSGGIYRFTRNPMYLGMLFSLGGWGLFLGSIYSLIWLPVFILYMNRFQIQPEERALGQLFGDEFKAYCSRVRRWI
ncbi:methyltransferase family protein [Endozoicomonadaceae bacterium StTr2]